jgi:hypothetical protein
MVLQLPPPRCRIPAPVRADANLCSNFSAVRVCAWVQCRHGCVSWPLLPQSDVASINRERQRRPPVGLSLAEDVCGFYGPVGDAVGDVVVVRGPALCRRWLPAGRQCARPHTTSAQPSLL